MPGEAEKLIDGLDIKKSTGSKSIPVFILKLLKVFLYFWFSQLINLSFKVIPLQKKECKLNFQNYRPISNRRDIPCEFLRAPH